MTLPGPPPVRPSDLLRAEDRLSFLFVEHAVVHRASNAVTITTARGTMHVPAATLGVLLLGPGTRITHQAVSLVAESGSTLVWVGEEGVRYYAHGRPLGRSTRLLERQAALVSSRRERLRIARRMYEMRFVGEDTSGLTMQQLRGQEGARVRKVYRAQSRRTGVAWKRREYRPDDFAGSDLINQALSAAHTALYGVVHAAVVALGCSPGLGFVHTGHDRSFVYDVADLYKADTSVPVAFEMTASQPADIGVAVRHRMRDVLRERRTIESVVKDIRMLLDDERPQTAPTDAAADVDTVWLWGDNEGPVAAGTNYELDW